MARENLNDLHAFVVVAEVKSFTKAAARLGVSQSALSHTIRGLESRLGLRLLTRTTRSVSATEAGDRLLAAIGPHFEEIENELEQLSELRERPVGTIRITAAQHSIDTLLWPKLQPFLRAYPDVRVEIAVQYGMTDIAAERFDAGVRLGEQVAKDMVAVRIGPDFRMAVVATPEYFRSRAIPKSPQDLTAHNCINLRLSTHGGLYAWEFEKGRREINVRVDGQLALMGAITCCRRRWLAWDSLTCQKTASRRIWRQSGCSECSTIGVRHSPAITFTIRAGARLHRRFHCWWKH